MVDQEPLTSIISSRGIKKVYVFHTDHWEPWVGPDNWGLDTDVVSGNIAKIRDFLYESEKFPHSQKQTLFYKIQVGHIGKSEWHRFSDIISLKDDAIGFRDPDDGIEVHGPVKEVISEIDKSYGHEIQLHVHHERYTRGDYFGYDEEFAKHNLTNNHIKDSKRLNLSIELLIKRMRIELGREFNDWSFVHGVWALNGSDSRVCNNLDEIEILMRNGCIADFTMPAGRPWVNSSILQPFTVIPVFAPKGYDFPESDATPVGQTPQVIDQRRFLIWNQGIDYSRSSLDYLTKSVLESLENTQEYLEHWFSRGFVIDDKLFIKTHAHSLNRKYELDENGFYPHQHPLVIKVFKNLEETCSFHNLDLYYSTVDEVLSELFASDNNLESFLKHPKTKESVKIDERRFFSSEEGEKIEKLGNSLLERSMSISDIESAGNYYLTRFEKNNFFTPAEKEILQYSLRKFPIKDTIFLESGPGIGTTLLLLKSFGYNGVGIEAESNRHRISEVVKQIAKDLAVNVRGLNFHRGKFPELCPRLRKNVKIAISTNVISSHTCDRHEEILDKFSSLDHILIDLGSFGRSRSGPEKDELEQEIIGRGMAREGVIYRSGRTEIIHYSRRHS